MENRMIKYPDIQVQLVGGDGNAFVILGTCLRAAKRNGLSQEEQQSFKSEATSGDYNHLLATCQQWFDCN